MANRCQYIEVDIFVIKHCYYAQPQMIFFIEGRLHDLEEVEGRMVGDAVVLGISERMEYLSES